MKRILILTLALVLLLGLAATPVMAAKGAVKADLAEYYGPGDLGSVVGSVILNTTASGSLIVVVNIDTIPDLENYDVRVWINGVSSTFVDVLSTNAKGNGNAQVKVNLPDPNGNSVTVAVVLRPDFVSNLLPCYATGWPADVIVPLKK